MSIQLCTSLSRVWLGNKISAEFFKNNVKFWFKLLDFSKTEVNLYKNFYEHRKLFPNSLNHNLCKFCFQLNYATQCSNIFSKLLRKFLAIDFDFQVPTASLVHPKFFDDVYRLSSRVIITSNNDCDKKLARKFFKTEIKNIYH